MRNIFFIDIAIAFFLALALGARGWKLLWALPVLWILTGIVAAQLQARFFPPKLEPWDGRKVV